MIRSVVWRTIGLNVPQGRVFPRIFPRYYSSKPVPATQDVAVKVETPKPMKGEYLIQFTCNPCSTRSTHTFSKQAYHYGTVLIQCPHCKNRHLISDNLGFARDNRINIEELLAAQGENIGKEKGDLVFENIPDSIKEKLNNVITGIKVETNK